MKNKTLKSFKIFAWKVEAMKEYCDEHDETQTDLIEQGLNLVFKEKGIKRKSVQRDYSDIDIDDFPLN